LYTTSLELKPGSVPIDKCETDVVIFANGHSHDMPCFLVRETLLFRKPAVCCAGRRRYADRPIGAVGKAVRSLKTFGTGASNAVRGRPARTHAASHAGRNAIRRLAY
jgi:hypothetical protein